MQRSEAFLPDTAPGILRQAGELDQAKVFQGTTERPFEVQKIVLDLATARREDNPYKIGFPFRSVFVAVATDTSANVSLKVNTADSFQSAFPLKKNDSFVFPWQLASGFLHWEAQAGKTMELYVFVSGEFRSGSQISVNSGGVSINEGSITTLGSVISVGAGRIQLCVANADRKIITFQNKISTSVWFGDSSVTDSGTVATEGIEVLPGQTFEFRNTGILYSWCQAAGRIQYLEET